MGHNTVIEDDIVNNGHRELISIGLTLGIVSLALFIIHHFIPSLLWASIIVIATYPLYQQWRKLFGRYHSLAALLFTLILVILLIKEMQLFFNYLQELNRHGGQAPMILHEIPFIGNELVNYWDHNFSEPGHLKTVLSELQNSITPASYYIKQVGFDIAHRSFQVGFTLLTVFFFYRDGDALFEQINRIGYLCLGDRWYKYANRLPAALRSTVNGTIVVGVGVGLLMGICYWLLHFPAPTLVGFITAIAAMIPFVVPIVFGVVALIMASQGSMLAAIIVVIWGTIVMFIADHMVKPALIGGAIQLPFLVVLFGILGGVETLGLLGLFLGPIIMVLFMTLWFEV